MGGKGWLTDSMNEWTNERGVCRKKHSYTRSVKYQQDQLYALASSEMLIINKYTIWNKVFLFAIMTKKSRSTYSLFLYERVWSCREK